MVKYKHFFLLINEYLLIISVFLFESYHEKEEIYPNVTKYVYIIYYVYKELFHYDNTLYTDTHIPHYILLDG